ncbi:MAG: ABC transporter ATP-binding protein [Oligoflexia bacterium]|nr:ABC transporter ATP-binding protein [Oligoflexia bacterium]
MIEVRHLYKTFGSVQALSDISFSVKPGVITGLLGPNACGKTTLIKSLLGLVVPTRGQILFDGKDIAGSYGYREEIGYMPQNPDFPSNLSPRELFALLRAVKRDSGLRQDECVELFGLGPFMKRALGGLSVGTRQKVSAVAALMFNPRILILDEPTAGLDPLAAATFKALVVSLAKNDTTVIFVSHVILELERVVEQILFLLDGKLHFANSVTELRRIMGKESLEESILELVKAETAVPMHGK